MLHRCYSPISSNILLSRRTFSKQMRQNKGMVMRSAEYAPLAYFKAFIRPAFPSLFRKTFISALPASDIPPNPPRPELANTAVGYGAQLCWSGEAQYTNHRQITSLVCPSGIPWTTRAQLRVIYRMVRNANNRADCSDMVASC